MASSVLLFLRQTYVPLCKSSVKLSNATMSAATRQLYAKASLGLDTFAQHQQRIREQMASTNFADKFREKMEQYSNADTKNMIFTEDLKNMVHLAENDEDIVLVVKMMKKFNQQNKQLRFGSFIFGPVVMRLFYLHNKVDLAFECFKAPEMNGFFDQLISYQILMDLLYENQKYNEMLETFQLIKDRQIEGTKYPKNIIVLTMAACYKLNSKEGLQFALNLWKELSEVGHVPMRRAVTFCAGLALNQGEPAVAIEILSSVNNPNYTTVRNLRVVAIAEMGRVEEALPILKSVLKEDEADNILHTFNRDVVNRVKTAVAKLDDPDTSLQFKKLEAIFEKQGHISNLTLDDQLCAEIRALPMFNNRQQNQFSRYDSERSNRNNKYTTFRQRPGLRDIA